MSFKVKYYLIRISYWDYLIHYLNHKPKTLFTILSVCDMFMATKENH